MATTETLYGLTHPYTVEPEALRRIKLEQAREVLQIQRTKAAHILEVLGMGMWLDSSGDHWLGYTDPDMHIHDRWFAVLTTRASGRDDQWRLVRTESNTEESSIFSHLLRASSIVQQLLMDELYTRRTNDLRRELGREPLQPQRLVIYMNLLNSVEERYFAPMGRDWNLTELHQLVHHYPAWVAMHPEAADMPQDIVLRMHGLHGVLNRQN